VPALPALLRRPLEAGLERLIASDGRVDDDFLVPRGEPALIAADSVSWQVCKNPLALFVGGITAVVLELSEPRVRSGVWRHTTFRERPLERLQRTGHAALLTVFGPRSRAEAMIERVDRRHARIQGVASDGRVYRATDPELLEWVHATACFGFVEAYHAYARPLAAPERDRFYAESVPVAERYGARSAPSSAAALDALFERMGGQLEGSDVVHEFLRIVRHMAVLPAPLRPLQDALVRASIDIVPAALRDRIGLADAWTLAPWQRRLVRSAGRALDRVVLRSNPAVLACRRLGLPDDWLYQSATTT
jgi:uncharacterized protein (DUF2236 family)